MAPKEHSRNTPPVFSIILVICAGLIAVVIYVMELQQSPLFMPEAALQKKYLQTLIRENSPDTARERLLAEAYWLRYSDVRTDPHWGSKGPMGVWGARDHFVLHGKREGRVFQPVIYPHDMEEEKALAASYWQRYPDIRKSNVWGEKSELGILGPRDHFTYIGRFEGRIWNGPSEKDSKAVIPAK